MVRDVASIAWIVELILTTFAFEKASWANANAGTARHTIAATIVLVPAVITPPWRVRVGRRVHFSKCGSGCNSKKDDGLGACRPRHGADDTTSRDARSSIESARLPFKLRGSGKFGRCRPSCRRLQ